MLSDSRQVGAITVEVIEATLRAGCEVSATLAWNPTAVDTNFWLHSGSMSVPVSS